MRSSGFKGSSVEFFTKYSVGFSGGKTSLWALVGPQGGFCQLDLVDMMSDVEVNYQSCIDEKLIAYAIRMHPDQSRVSWVNVDYVSS